MFVLVFILSLPQTISTLLVWLLAMVLHPEVQAKAQADIDRVVGKDRLPNFDDRTALPYLDAIARETHRWHPVFPMGLYAYRYPSTFPDVTLRCPTFNNYQ